jgi:DNA-binding FadR family transcriptional regulator
LRVILIFQNANEVSMADKRLYRKVADRILEMIDSGAYPPGTRLPGERELAEKFKVSRVVVREAEISLEAVGRVEIKVGSGVHVREPKMGLGNVMPSVSAFELTQTRLLFESECAALAARMISDEQIAELADLVKRMEGEHAPIVDSDDTDRQFHMKIAEASGNQANVFVMENLWRIRSEVDTVKSVYAAVCKKDTGHRFEEHYRIFETIRDRDPDSARVAMKEHFSRLIEALVEASEEQAINEIRKRSSINRERYLTTVLQG